jgi:hypothetical protein
MTKIRTGAAVLLGAAGLSAIASLVVPAPSAQATPSQNAEYCAILSQNGLYNSGGCVAESAIGRQIASDISLGLRTPLQERDYVYSITNDSVSVLDANVMVNTATSVWLGFGATHCGC